MNLKESEMLIQTLLQERDKTSKDDLYYEELTMQINRIQKHAYESLTPWDRVYLARDMKRAKAQDYISGLIDDFYELHGDRGVGDDGALMGGIGYFEGRAITVLAQVKGKSTEENILRNFGMMNPEGYRKALRLAKQAEKFNRPILNIVDTSGAFPGKEAEERGQAEAIAKCLFEFSDLNVPIISLVIGEGGSGGALALSIADYIIMMEHAIYSILSPEGFASILWKDASKAQEAADLMELTSQDLYRKKIVDEIIKEPYGGVQDDMKDVLTQLKKSIHHKFNELEKENKTILLEKRYEKYRKIGTIV